jgi:hypothetical protein
MGELCDPVRGCLPAVALGAACTSDAECSSGVCADRTAARVTSGPARFCSKACCSDDDCEAGFICWASGTGAKLCVAEGVLGLTRGGTGGSQSCAAASDCKSGVCFTDGCLGNCGHDSQCSATGDRCTMQTYMRSGSPFSQLMCDGPAGGGDFNEWCYLDGCISGLCISSYCTRACRTAADCGSRFPACGYAYDSTGSVMQVCTSAIGASGAGATCDANTDCLEGACVGSRCVPTCCSDADCAGMHCKPMLVGETWEMHCG